MVGGNIVSFDRVSWKDGHAYKAVITDTNDICADDVELILEDHDQKDSPFLGENAWWQECDFMYRKDTKVLKIMAY